MAKDFFQDIVPPANESGSRASKTIRVTPRQRAPEPVETTDSEVYADDDISESDTENSSDPAPSRGIRNINMPPRARYRTANNEVSDAPSMGRGFSPRTRSSMSRKWLWVVVVVCIIVLGFFGIFLFRKTTVTITQRTQTITFDQTSQFSAYPSSSSATGTLAYSVASTDIQDSDTVQGNGTTQSQMKATGSITVYNGFSVAPVKLIKNTRFQTPAGLIFKAPADIVVPGKSGTTPGHVTVTVVADQAGQQYNIGPTARFTVPGLQSNAAMFAAVYAQSTGSMSGGFSGEQQGVSESARQAAVADIRSRLAQKVAQYVQSQNSDATVAFTGLAQITYSDMPDVDATGTQVTIAETAHIVVPTFEPSAFSKAVAQAMAVDTGNTPVRIVGIAGYGAQSTNSSQVSLGSDPLDFSLVGSAHVLWTVDVAALSKALAGRDQSVFQTVIGGFPGIEAARARIEPFWVNSFPADPSKINITLVNPVASSTSQG